jgi:hypothetical protein
VSSNGFEVLTAGINNEYLSVFSTDTKSDEDLSTWIGGFPKLFNVHFASWYNKVEAVDPDSADSNADSS